MRPQRTDQYSEAFDAYYHSTDVAGALELVNEYSGCAALPAPYNGFAELKLACSCL